MKNPYFHRFAVPGQRQSVFFESFNDWGGGDTIILSPVRSTKPPLPGLGLHDPLHDRQACPKFNSFHPGGSGQTCPPWEGLFSCRPHPERGQICDIPHPSQSLNDSFPIKHSSRCWLLDIQGVIPAELGELRGLKELGLAHNRLVGPIPVSLGGLVCLQSLSLSCNSLEGKDIQP